MPRGCLALLLLLALVLSGCGSVPRSSASKTTEPIANIRWFVAGSPGIDTLDPAHATDAASIDIISLLFEGLVRLGSNMHIQPAAASSWKETRSGHRYVFTLRRGLRFSNGRKVTSKDAVASIDRALAPANANGEMAGYLSELSQINGHPAITALGPRRVQFLLAYPSAAFLAKLAFVGLDIVDISTVKRYGAVWTLHADGLGPYRLNGTASGKTIRLLPNRNFRPKPPHQPVTVEFGSVSRAVARFRSGQADIVTGLSPSTPLPNSLKQDEQLAPLQTLDYVMLNTRGAALKNVRLRRALELALNRRQITDEVFGKSSRPVASLVPPSLLPHAPQQAYSPKVAQKQLAIARRQLSGKIPTMRLIYNDEAPYQKRWADILSAAWYRVLGIQVQQSGLSGPSYVAAIHDGDFGMATVRWGAEYPDAGDFLLAQLDHWSRDDFARWDNVRFNGLMKTSQRFGIDSIQRRRDLLDAEKIAALQAPWIPMDSPLQMALISPRVPGIKLTDAGVMGLRPAR